MAITLKRIKQLDQMTTVPTDVDLIVNDSNGVSKRAQLSDILSLANLPEGALERLIEVTDQAARFALTTSDVQLGDSVKQLDTGVMYIVVDTTKLNQEAGYKEYVAGTAAKALADESGNNIKSNYASSIELNNDTVSLKNKNGTTLSSFNLPSTSGSVGTFYGAETTASASASAKTATVTDNSFALADGVTVVIKFINTNTCVATAQAPITLNVNNTGAKNIIVKNGDIPLGDNPTVFGKDDYYNTYVYDGTSWVWQACSQKGLDNTHTFIGTTAEWEALTSAEQAEYVFVEFIDDGGYGSPYDIAYNDSTVGGTLDNINNYLGVKNLIPYPYASDTTLTSNNVTFSQWVNSIDGEVVVTTNGAASADTTYLLYDSTSANGTKIDTILSGCPSGGSDSTYYLFYETIEGIGDPVQYKETGEGLSVPAGTYIYKIGITVKSGTNLSTMIRFKPMLRPASSDDTWVSYTKTNRQLTEDVVFGGFPTVTVTDIINSGTMIGKSRNYILRSGARFNVRLMKSNTYVGKLVLAINSTESKDVYINGTISSSTNYSLPAGDYSVYYDGTNYYFNTTDEITALNSALKLSSTTHTIIACVAASQGTGCSDIFIPKLPDYKVVITEAYVKRQDEQANSFRSTTVTRSYDMDCFQVVQIDWNTLGVLGIIADVKLVFHYEHG